MKPLAMLITGALTLLLLFCVGAYIIQTNDCMCHHAAYQVIDWFKN